MNCLVVKMKTLSQDDIILLAVDHFGSEWFESSTKVLFELHLSSTQCFAAHKGLQKDVNNVKSCLTFNNFDVSCLLGKIEHLSMDISTMTQAMSVKTNVCKDLRTVTVDINQRL